MKADNGDGKVATGAVDLVTVVDTINESSSFEQQQEKELAPKGIVVEEQQAPSPPTVLSLPKRKPRAWVSHKLKPASPTETTTESVESSPPPDEERQDKDNMPPPAAATIVAASPHPWRRDLAFKQHVNSKQRTPKQRNESETVGSSSSSLSRYRTSYRTLLQQRKQVFEHITIQEEEGDHRQNKSLSLDEEGEGDEDDEESESSSYNDLQQHDEYDLPLLPSRRASSAGDAPVVPVSSSRNVNMMDDSIDDCLSLGMSMQSSVNRNAIRTLLQQEIKVRVQQIYTGDFYCVVGMSETDGQPYRRRSAVFGRHGRPLDHPIFSPRFVQLQDELKSRLEHVYTADHYIVEAMGGMTTAKQTQMARQVHEQAFGQVMTEFNEKLKSLRSLNSQASGLFAGFSCWDDEEADDDDDDCCSSSDDEQQQQHPRFDVLVRNSGQQRGLCPDDEQDDNDECPLDELQQDGRIDSRARRNNNKPPPLARDSGSRSLSPHPSDDKKKDNNTVVVVEHLEPTNSTTDEDDEDDNVVVTEYSPALQGKNVVAQELADVIDSEWDEYTVLSASVAAPPEAAAHNSHNNNVDDDDAWDEYTVQSASVAAPPKTGAAAQNVNDDDEYDEYTVCSAAVPPPPPPPSKAVRQAQERMMSSRMFTDFNPNTMNKTNSRQVVVAAMQQSSQKQPDDDEYTEYTIQSQVSSALPLNARKAAARTANASSKQKQPVADDDEYTEYTIQSQVFSALPLNARKAAARTANASSKDNNNDEEYDEYTIYDSSVAVSVVDEAQAARQRQLQLLNRSRFAREQAANKAREGGSPRTSPRSSTPIRKQEPAVSTPRPTAKEDDWEEYTIFSSSKPSSPSNPIVVTTSYNNNDKSSPASALSSTPRGAVDNDNDDDNWEEYTIQESVALSTVKKGYAPPAPLVDTSRMSAVKKGYSSPATLVDTSAFGHSRMFSSFDPKSSSDKYQDNDDDISDNDDDDEMTTEQYIHCPGDASVVSAFTMEPGWHQHEEAIKRRNQFCNTAPKSPKSTSQGGTRTAPTCDASSADSSNNNNKASTTLSVISASQCSATSGSSCNAAGSKRIAELLRRDIWSKNEKVVHKAMLELLFDAAQGPECCARIVRYGGPLAIMCAMEANPNHVDIQIAACGTIEQLAAAGNNIDVVNSNGRNFIAGEQPPPPSDHRVTLGEVGAVQSVVTAMKADMDHVELQRVACSALVNLTRHGALNDIALDGAVETVTKALTRHTSDPTIQEMAFVALGNLCMENTTRLLELSQVGGLAAMTTALQRPWKNPMEKQGAISTLSMLLRAQAECCFDDS